MTTTETRAALDTLCGHLADALTEADPTPCERGGTWSCQIHRLPEDWRDHDQRGPGAFARAVFTRESDGFQIEIAPSTKWNQGDKAVATIRWPENPNREGVFRLMHLRDAPGQAYDAEEPQVGFTVSKAKPGPLARRIVRHLLAPGLVEARRGMLVRIEFETAARRRAEAWREAVAGAAGFKPYARAGDSALVWPYRKPDAGVWAQIKSDPARADSGTLEIGLPSDPREAAALVAAVRALVVGEGG